MTTKRFTPKASTYTTRLAEVQARKAKLAAQVAALQAEEDSLKAFLLDFYDEGVTEVTDADGKLLHVRYAVTERTYLHQERARALLMKKGVKVPEFTAEVISFKVSSK